MTTPSFFKNSFYFARHGETASNVASRVTGAADIPLNANGRAQAIMAQDIVKQLGIQTCIVSSLMRAQETARLMAAKISPKFISTDTLKERYWGKLEGVLKSELDQYDFNEMGVEPWENFLQRSVLGLSGMTCRPPVLIVAHSGTFRAYCVYLQIKIKKKPVENAAPYHFYQKNGIWKAKLVSSSY